MSAVERLSRFVDAILRDRRPRRYPAEEEEAAAMVAAAALKGFAPGRRPARPEFIAELEQKLAREMAGDVAAPPPGAAAGSSRLAGQWPRPWSPG